MEKQTSASKGILTFLVGGAIGVGAGLLLSRACSTGQEAEGKTGDGESACRNLLCGAGRCGHLFSRDIAVVPGSFCRHFS